jgi:acetate kinase
MKILVVNVGSTSLKFRLFEMPDECVLAEGRIERVGAARSPVSYRTGHGSWRRMEAECGDQRAAIEHAVRLLADGSDGTLTRLDDLAAIGFKPVHARDIADSVFITDAVIKAMEEYVFLAPAHNPPYIEAFRTFRELLPNTPLVGVFEPAFHRSIPDHARTYGIPYEWTEKHAIRRYGFHGASHRYVSLRVPQLVGRPADALRVISCHLGGSSSICAIQGGMSLDTSMGLSPQSGLPHSNRCGDLDPFVVLYAMVREGLTPEEMAAQLATNGGLKGISGLSGDVRDLEEAAARGNARAELALRVLAYEARKYIGAYVAVLEGLDVLAFTGGIGENAAAIREGICRGLECLGITLDAGRNATHAGEGIISTENSAVTVVVIPANEELVIARETTRLVSDDSRSGGA